MVVAFLIANYLFSVPLKAVHIQNHHFYLFFTFPNWGFSSTCRCSSRRGCTCTWGSAGFGHLDFRGCRKGWRVRSLGMVLNEPFWWTIKMEFWWCFVCCGCAAESHISLIDMILQEIIEDKFTQVQPRRERNKTWHFFNKALPWLQELVYSFVLIVLQNCVFWWVYLDRPFCKKCTR